MNHQNSSNPYSNVATERTNVASQADVDARLSFIRKTYLHLAAAIMAFVGVEFAIFQTGIDQLFLGLMLSWGQLSWLLTLGVFMAVGYAANRMAMSNASQGLQYAGLGLYVLAEAIIFVPLLYMATAYSDPTVIPAAGFITLSVFSVLTGYVFVSKQDFSFLGPALAIGGAAAMALILAGYFFGFSLGLFFAGAMVVLSAVYILYYTSNVLHHYNTDQHVAASLALFSSVALLFYYVLMLLMGSE